MIAKRSALLILFLILPATAFAARRYVVKKGDNLYNLARRFGVSVLSIKKLNSLNDDRLSIDDTLLIPDSTNMDVSVNQNAGLRVCHFKEGLNVDSHEKFGQRLNVGGNQPFDYIDIIQSASSTSGTSQTISTNNQLRSAREYIVVQDDTLGKIGKKFGVSTKDIVKENNLSSIKLKIGQRLIIPSSSNSKSVEKETITFSKDSGTGKKGSILSKDNVPTVFTKYLVKKGDTLGRIAKQFRISSEELKRANRLTNNDLKIGLILTVPGSESKTVVNNLSSQPINTKSQEGSPTGPREYFVKNRDTLGKIAKRFGISVKNLKNANGLENDDLRIGARLIIPDNILIATKGTRVFQASEAVSLKVTGTNRYVVKKGDSLDLIAKKFKVSVRNLRDTNGINGSNIRIGQVLRVPGQVKVTRKTGANDIEISTDKTGVKTSPEVDDQGNRNIVNDSGVSGDSIIKIAKRFLGIPYKFGGTSLIKGLDCSAFVNKVFSFFNIGLPRTAREIYKVGQDVDRAELAAGDLVFFRTYASYPSHVGIYVGDSEFIHASSKAKRVTIDSINRPYFVKRYIGAKRIGSSGLFYEEMSNQYKGFEKQ